MLQQRQNQIIRSSKKMDNENKTIGKSGMGMAFYVKKEELEKLMKSNNFIVVDPEAEYQSAEKIEYPIEGVE
jgi:hypothetical protein